MVHKIRFTASEWALVEDRARASGRAPARYVREVALGAVPKVSRTRANAPVIRELGAIAAAVHRLRATVAIDGDAAAGASTPARDAMHPHRDAPPLDLELRAVLDGLLAIVRRLA